MGRGGADCGCRGSAGWSFVCSSPPLPPPECETAKSKRRRRRKIGLRSREIGRETDGPLTTPLARSVGPADGLASEREPYGSLETLGKNALQQVTEHGSRPCLGEGEREREEAVGDVGGREGESAAAASRSQRGQMGGRADGRRHTHTHARIAYVAGATVKSTRRKKYLLDCGRAAGSRGRRLSSPRSLGARVPLAISQEMPSLPPSIHCTFRRISSQV